MKTKLTRRIAVTALALLLLCGTALAAGVIKTQMIEANYMGIKLVVNGIEVTPKDAAGHEVEPFASNGTTYLPVRAVAAALGQDVEWDGETKTVYIGDNIPGKETNWMQKLPPYQLNNAAAYDGSDHTKSFTVAGIKQSQGVVMQTKGYNRDNIAYTWEGYEGSVIWNTNCEYKTMKVTVGHMGNQQMDCQMEVYLDGVYSTTYDVPWAAAPKALSIPVNYAPNVQLKLVVLKEQYLRDTTDTQYGLYNISFE